MVSKINRSCITKPVLSLSVRVTYHWRTYDQCGKPRLFGPIEVRIKNFQITWHSPNWVFQTNYLHHKCDIVYIIYIYDRYSTIQTHTFEINNILRSYRSLSHNLDLIFYRYYQTKETNFISQNNTLIYNLIRHLHLLVGYIVDSDCRDVMLVVRT